MGDTSSMTASQSSDLMNASMATSAIASIAGTIENVKAIKAQSSYAETISRTNAALGKLKAAQVIEAGDIAASRKNLQTQSQIGTIRSQGGASGFDVNKGSPAMEQSSVGTAGAIDELTIKNNAARSAWGFETQSINDTFQGQITKLDATTKVQQSIANGGLQAISGPLGIYANYLRWSRYMGGGGGGGSGIIMPWSSSPGVNTPNNDASANFDMRTG